LFALGKAWPHLLSQSFLLTEYVIMIILLQQSSCYSGAIKMPDDLDKKYLSINNFKIRFDDGLGNDPSMLLGYLYAIDTIMPDLKQTIETVENFDDLKKEILNKITSHLEFRTSIDAIWDSHEAKEFGLPLKSHINNNLH
jgi:hypothetical protein